MKKCTKCGVEKDESEFYPRAGCSTNRVKSECKACTLKLARAWKAANPDKRKAGNQKWKEANPDKVKAYGKKWRDANPDKVKARDQKWREARPEDHKAQSARAVRKIHQDPIAKARRMIGSSKTRAKKRGLPHSISYEDLLPIPSVCPALGTPLSLSGTYINGNVASLDRINNNIGYVPGNVAVISRRANSIKNDATIEELELVLAYMKRHAAQQEAQQQDQQEQGSEPRNT